MQERRSAFHLHAPGDNHPHDFVRSFQNLMHPHVPEMALQGIFPDIAIAAVKLKSLVANLKGAIRGEALRHGAVERSLGVPRIEAGCGQAHHLPRGQELRRHVREFKLGMLEGADGWPNCCRSPT